jgi:hypothetical protein
MVETGETAGVEGLLAKPELYAMMRREDASGVSGSGLVAWVTRYPNGKCSVAWHAGPVRSVVVYDALIEVEAIHGHGGRTELVRVFPSGSDLCAQRLALAGSESVGPVGPVGAVRSASTAARPASSLATGTRNAEQDT